MLNIVISLFISGILFGSGPCLISCGPVLLSYIVGTNKNIVRSFRTYFLFSLARAFIYCLFGIIAYFLGNFTPAYLFSGFTKYIVILGVGFIVLIGVLMIVGVESHIFSAFLCKHILERDTKSIVILGLIAGILPCAPLLAVLSYIGLVSKSWYFAFVYSLSFGLGTTLSLLLPLSMGAGLIPRFKVQEKKVYSRILSILCGSILIFFAIQLLRRIL
ncbi:MAG: sulfite exporter TauE/SafE family protein [Candidatus Omnitrophica bacterium]|nr:sulfite exporter TauE/SafE family protein [Candidatus Omnitrophota bacterium]